MTPAPRGRAARASPPRFGPPSRRSSTRDARRTATARSGLLNPHLYPLAGTTAFNDVTSGDNGAYSAGPGYDLCTGLGSPNVANLLAALGGQTTSQRLANISSRAQVETGGNILIAGFVIQGNPATSKRVLVRGIGPALTGFNVSGGAQQPGCQRL